MSFALLYPERVHTLCSIDSVPVDRNPFPEMNNPTSQMVKSGLQYLAEIEKRSYHDAFKFLQGQLSHGNKIFISALMIQLDRRQKGETTKLNINLRDLSKDLALRQIFGFDFVEGHETSPLDSKHLLFINGGTSTQIEVTNSIEFY